MTGLVVHSSSQATKHGLHVNYGSKPNEFALGRLDFENGSEKLESFAPVFKILVRPFLTAGACPVRKSQFVVQNIYWDRTLGAINPVFLLFNISNPAETFEHQSIYRLQRLLAE
jgi:hypothetical protein